MVWMPHTSWGLCTATLSLRIFSLLSVATPKFWISGLAKLNPESVDEVPVATDATAGPAEVGLTMPGVVMGTAAYMSPEQVRGEVLDSRTDIFSFGVVLYEMATGQLAFKGTTMGIVAEAILNRAPEPLRRLVLYDGSELERIVNLALQKDRNLRYQTAADIRRDL